LTARAVPIEDAETVVGIALAHIDPDALVCTDESRACLPVGAYYTHETVNHSAKEFVNDMASTNGIESVWAGL